MPVDWSVRHRPWEGEADYHYRCETIADYLEAARRHVEAARVDLDGRADRWILEGNSPFTLTPDGDSPRRAILMVHGLTDSPFAMRDLGAFFQRAGFYVVAMQLPGHGTRPGDLLDVRWHDWVRAHRHLLSLLYQRFDAVYACGFSAGATLSLHQSLLDARIRGLFLFAPAVAVSPFMRLAAPLSRLGRTWRRLAWFDIQPDEDYFKYESLALRAVAEVSGLIEATRALERLSDHRVPLFVVASEQDATLRAPDILKWYARQTGPRQMLYYSAGEPQVPAFVKRIDSRLPGQRIRSFAHTSLIQSPDNPHYGARGTQRVCMHYYRTDPGKFARCKAGEEDCLGEMFDESADCKVIRRLTFNPFFNEMLEEMRAFIAAHIDA